MSKHTTIVQRRASDARLFGAAGYALLLQVAHPTIAAGVREHSNYAVDPWGRFFGTVDWANLFIYGSPDQIATASTRLREMHRRIRGTDLDGTKYSALEPGAYAWVYATLADAVVRGHHVFGRPFTAAEKNAFWVEWRRIGVSLGVRPGDLPDSWDGYLAYRTDMVENVLSNNDVIEALHAKAARAVGGSPFPWLPPRVWGVAGRPLGKYGRFLGHGTLGPQLREKFDIPWSGRQQAAFSRVAAAHRALTPVLPPPLRTAGPLIMKVRKREIAAGPFS